MLDSLVIALGYERYGPFSSIADDLPLLISHEIPHASQMLVGVPDVPVVRSTTLVQSFIRVLTTNPMVTEILDRQPAPSLMSHGSGPNSNVESTYLTHNIPRVYFLGVGDIERLQELTLTLAFIGSQCHKGNGEIEQITFTPVDADPTWFGILGTYDGDLVVLRPIPKRLVSLLPKGVYGYYNDETHRAPYFRGHPQAVVEPCLVPPFVHGEGFHRDVVKRMCRL